MTNRRGEGGDRGRNVGEIPDCFGVLVAELRFPQLLRLLNDNSGDSPGIPYQRRGEEYSWIKIEWQL
jgi:hypothetical protein